MTNNTFLTTDAAPPDAAQLHLLEGISFQPIFIIGPHRSGTTVLHHLLQETGSFNVVTAYHILNYGEIMTNHLNEREVEAKQALNQRFAALGLANRIVDDAPVSADHSEEYGFVLDETAWEARANPANIHRLVELCRKIQFTAPADRPILLKNPWDFSLFMFLRQQFAQARFVFIHRHPVAVINSQLKFLRALIQERNPYMALLSPGYARRFERPLRKRLVQGIITTSRLNIAVRNRTRAFVRAVDYYLTNIAQLPPEVYLEVTYEALCADPTGVVNGITSFLQRPGGHPINPQAVKPRPLKLARDVQRYQPAILAKTTQYRQRFHFPDTPPA